MVVMTMMMKKNLVCVGACYLDTILSVPLYPEEDSKLRATNLQVRRGGNCPNTLQVFQQLLREPGRNHNRQQQQQHHVKTYLISCLPSRDAPATATISESFGPGSAVDLSRCIYRASSSQAASSYILRSEASGSRTLVNYTDLPEMTPEEFVMAVDDLGDDTWFHFEGRIPETTLQCIRYLRRSKAKAVVSVEVEKPGREGLEELAAEADVVFYSRSWAEVYDIGQAVRECSALPECPIGRGPASVPSPVYVGIARCILFIITQREICVLPGDTAGTGDSLMCTNYKDIPAVSTVGAGDTFIAGMLFGLLCHTRDWDDEKKVRFAVQLATLKVQQEGFDGVGAEVARLECGVS
ncbi:Ribokinase-like protein [Biscogniauxia mediterranea]|nr:Ribokinase-like protein [Biscogniauxia mediterranea]